jgi:hypothetical protein
MRTSGAVCFRDLTRECRALVAQFVQRKTGMNDAMWIADLLSCGLIKASFVPEQEIQELRAAARASS